MVANQIETRGVRDPVVLAAMRAVPRHRFVPEALRANAYGDVPLSVGHGQTISQPYIVARMTELLRPDRSMKVLEIGTGSGYQTAVLAECVGEVFTIEIVPELAARSRALLAELGYANVRMRVGDGHAGWAEGAPFDGILVTAAPEAIPPILVDQLALHGRLVVPIGTDSQQLMRVTRDEDQVRRETVLPVRFVPMTGKPLL